MPEIITGLDIGSSQVKCVVAEKQKDGSLKIISAVKEPSLGLRRGVLVDAEYALSTLAKLVSELKASSKNSTKNLYVNFQSEHTKVRISRGISAVSQPDKEIKQEDIDRAVQSSRAAKMLPNFRVLHTIVREFLVDEIGDIIFSPLGMTGSRLEVTTLIAEAFSPHLDVLTKTLGAAGVNPGGIVFNPFAASKAVLSKKQKELGVIMIDLGAHTTSIAVFEENKPLFAKSFPVGSNHITKDIAIGLRVPVDVAEKIKNKHGCLNMKNISRKESFQVGEQDGSLNNEIPKKFLSEIIETRISEIFDLVNSELKPLKNKYQFPSGIVLTGGGVKLLGVQDHVRDHLKLPTQIGAPNLTNFEISNQSFESLVDDPEFSTAIGLVMIGAEEESDRSPSLLDSVKRIFKNIIP